MSMESSVTVSGSSAAPPHSFGIRWVICGLLFFATTVNYLDRQVLSILAPSLQADLRWSETDYANIVFAFQCAYALALPLAGRMIDRLGTRYGYSLFVGLWSVVTMVHVMARSAFGFGLARFFLGVTEAGNFPAAIKAVSEWFPKSERALATGIFNSGGMVGAIVAPLTVPILATRYGWQSAFLILGAVGLVWIFLWVVFYELPKRNKWVKPRELAWIEGEPEEETRETIPWRSLLGSRGTWAFIVGKFLSDPVWWFFLFWLPKFLGKQYGLDLTSMGLPLGVIYTVSALGSIGGGWFASRLLRAGWSLNKTRKVILLGCALAVVPVFLAAQTHSLWMAVALISLATAAHCAWMANVFSMVSDMFPRTAVGAVTGIGGTAGSLGGMLIALATGWLLETTGTYWLLFVFASSSYLVAWIIIQWLVPTIQPIPLEKLLPTDPSRQTGRH